MVRVTKDIFFSGNDICAYAHDIARLSGTDVCICALMGEASTILGRYHLGLLAEMTFVQDVAIKSIRIDVCMN